MTNENKEDKDEIKYLEKEIKDRRPTDDIYIKLNAFLKVKLGNTRVDVGKDLYVNRRTVGRWVKLYDDEGIDGLYDN